MERTDDERMDDAEEAVGGGLKGSTARRFSVETPGSKRCDSTASEVSQGKDRIRWGKLEKMLGRVKT